MLKHPSALASATLQHSCYRLESYPYSGKATAALQPPGSRREMSLWLWGGCEREKIICLCGRGS